MKLFEATSSRVEVNGETVLAIMAGMGTLSARAGKILASHGLLDPQPGVWYRQQAWLNAFRDIAGTLGPNTLYRIGLKIPEWAHFPPHLDSMAEALRAIDVAYRMNHRGGDLGSYTFQAMGPTSGRMICRNPYPSDFDRGIIQAMANRFKGEGRSPEVVLDPSQPTRKAGAESCTFLVTW